MTNKPLVNIIIPTFNNIEYLRPCLQSLIKYHTSGLYDITLVNNGHPRSLDWIDDDLRIIKKINLTKNAGWEGGIMTGLDNTSSELVLFMNDDVHIPDSSAFFIHRLAEHFKNPKVAAIGPSSNCVMGLQNMFSYVQESVFPVSFLIGFCVMMRRSAFEKIGGMDYSLSGGDDLDWSIRLRDAGYTLLVDREIFIYHHGFKTGTRTMGDAQTVNGWNSYEMTERTNLGLIKKHGLKKWFDTLYKQKLPYQITESIADSEGTIIRILAKNYKKIIDIGCGGNKTLPRAKGIDFVPKGKRIPTLGNLFDDYVVSDADIEADVSKNLPIENNSQDMIIARHILEHMTDIITALENWIDKLKEGGKIVIAVPNHENINSIPMNLEHVHAFTPKSLAVLLRSMGLKDIVAYDSQNAISFIMEGTK